jgi:hypothetical protein
VIYCKLNLQTLTKPVSRNLEQQQIKTKQTYPTTPPNIYDQAHIWPNCLLTLLLPNYLSFIQEPKVRRIELKTIIITWYLCSIERVEEGIVPDDVLVAWTLTLTWFPLLRGSFPGCLPLLVFRMTNAATHFMSFKLTFLANDSFNLYLITDLFRLKLIIGLLSVAENWKVKLINTRVYETIFNQNRFDPSISNKPQLINEP